MNEIANIQVTEILKGHDSAETAYVVNDYPYGFRLRCKIRYWLESSPKKGTRFVSQTSNPKVAGEVWNKPKASTYCVFGGTMYRNELGYVCWTGMHEYMNAAEMRAWLAKFGEGLPAKMAEKVALVLKIKEKIDAKRNDVNANLSQIAAEAIAEAVKETKVNLPPEPTGLIKFRVTSNGPGAIPGYIFAENATQAAEKLGGKLAQSAPNWGLVVCDLGKAFHIDW